MSERRSESGSITTLEIILEFGHKAVLKDVPVQVKVDFFLNSNATVIVLLLIKSKKQF